VIAQQSPVHEITGGRAYDVADIRGEVIGEEVPAWVARVIAACEPAVLVRVHSYADLPWPGVTVRDERVPPLRPGRFFTW